MLNKMTMLDYKIIDVSRPEIFFKFQSSEETEKNIQVYGAFISPPLLNSIIEEITHGFLEGLIPTLIPDGTSGTYNMRNLNKEVVALFKPIDEEAFAPNNQKGYVGKFGQEGFRKGILSGEGSIREVAAYLLDKDNYFGVPETTFVEMTHPTFNKNINDLLIEDESFPKMRNSMVHHFILENIISMSNNNKITETAKLNSTDNKYSAVIKKNMARFKNL